ncbi:MAG TPA: thiamine diphosphokinase [Candidatus Limnocylindrales bacterium]|nr:thiamine diphosphokinase [Candidatus Limnocylindrales bacterium]
MPPDGRRAIVLADGTVAGRSTMDAAWPGWDDGVSLVVAADGGASHALALGLAIDRWVGDGDSIDAGDLAALAASGVRVDRVPAEKDAADAELALQAAIDAGAEGLILLGGLGGSRLDHGLANLGLLLHPALAERPLVLFDEHAARITLLAAIDGPATVELLGRLGDIVSLLPVGATAEGVRTEGLQYPLRDEPLLLGRTRGVSNVRTAPTARVTLGSGRVLVIETPVTVDR